MQAEKEGLRSANFRKLAVKVYQLMSYELEDIEALLNVKYQRKMINALLESDAGVQNWLQNYRWQLRSLQLADSFYSLVPHSLSLLTEKDFAEARTYLLQWLDDAHSTLKTPKLEFLVAFEVAEQLFDSEAYQSALSLFQRCQKLLSSNESLIKEVNEAKKAGFSVGDTSSAPPRSLVHSICHLPRSTQSLPLLESKLAGFLQVLSLIPSKGAENETGSLLLSKIAESPLPSSPITRLDTLITSLESMALHQDASRANQIRMEVLALLEKDLEAFFLSSPSHAPLPSIPLQLRLLISSWPSLSPIHEQIRHVNLVWRTIYVQTENPNISWISRVTQPKAAFQAIQSRLNSLPPSSPFIPRFKSLLEILMDQFLETASSISQSQQDDASQQSYPSTPNISMQLSSPLESLRFDLSKMKSGGVSISSKKSAADLSNQQKMDLTDGKTDLDAFIRLTESRDEDELKRSALLLSAARGPQLISRVLNQRALQSEASGDFEGAKAMYGAVKSMQGGGGEREESQKVSPAEREGDSRLENEWSLFLASLQQSSSDSLDFQGIAETMKGLVEGGCFPSKLQTEKLGVLLLNRTRISHASVNPSSSGTMRSNLTSSNTNGSGKSGEEVFESISKCFSVLKQNASSVQLSYITPVLTLIESMLRIHEESTRLQPGNETSVISNAFSIVGTNFEAMISLVVRDTTGWINNWIGEVRREDVLTTMSAFLAFCVDFVYRSAKVPCEALRIDRVSKTLASVSGERGHGWMEQVKSVRLAEMNSVISFFCSSLFALQRSLPSAPSPLLLLGDISLLQSQHETALRYYLRASLLQIASANGGAGDSSWDSSASSSPSSSSSSFSLLLPTLIHCFVSSRLLHYAVLLHQYATPIDYPAAIALTTAAAPHFPFFLFPFLFDLPLLETLTNALHTLGNLSAARSLSLLIASPDHLATESSPKLLLFARSKLLLHLAQRFLNNGSWTGLDS